MHPDAEGVFVPLLYGRGTEPQELVDQWHNHLESYDPDKVSVWLKELALDELLEPISIWDIRGTTLEGQDGWGEAWLPVRIKEAPENTDNWELLHDFVGHYAILTYSNSD